MRGVKGATETLNGDGDMSKSHRAALKNNEEALKRDGELKSHSEEFRAKKRP